MSLTQNTVLFIDDDVTAAQSIANSMRRRGFQLETIFARTPSEALTLCQRYQPEAIVLDLSLHPDEGPQGGLRFLETLQTTDPSVRILILTGHDSEEYGIESLRRGAASFLSKPVHVEHLHALLTDAIQSTVLKRSYLRLTRSPESAQSLVGLSSRSERMIQVIESVAYAASNTQPVLLVGETGVGKGIIAQAIHRTSSRRDRPFVRVHPRFGNADLTSSEIFGHERGAFTGAIEARKGLIEDANGGTLFLDEVDELSTETQILLLNALQEKRFRRLGSNKELRSDFRLITATNRNIEESLRKEKLRDDFYHRIAHLTIEIPPLRERPEDIPDLANGCLRDLSNRENLQVHGLDREAMERLREYDWPGNVRELFAMVEGGAYRAQFQGRRCIEVRDLLFKKKAAGLSAGSFWDQVEKFQLRIIQEALAKCDNNKSQAARMLQLDRSSLIRILTRSKME